MSSPPYMQFYIGDYLKDTHHLSVTEHGAYLLLLINCWRLGGYLPADDAQLMRLARCNQRQWGLVKETVLAFFEPTENGLTQGRLLRELAKYEIVVEKRRCAAEIGVKAKRFKKQSASEASGSSSAEHMNGNVVPLAPLTRTRTREEDSLPLTGQKESSSTLERVRDNAGQRPEGAPAVASLSESEAEDDPLASMRARMAKLREGDYGVC